MAHSGEYDNAAVIDCFSDAPWTDETIVAWLASFFEHAGELDVRRTGVVLTFEGRDRNVIRALRSRLGLGEIVERLRRRRPMYCWRITEPQDVERVLSVIRPYLTSGHEAACQALQQLADNAARERDRHRRDREIVASWLSGGRSKNSIAEAFGVGLPVVIKAIKRFQKSY